MLISRCQSWLTRTVEPAPFEFRTFVPGTFASMAAMYRVTHMLATKFRIAQTAAFFSFLIFTGPSIP